jgi:hypothetical protein
MNEASGARDLDVYVERVRQKIATSLDNGASNITTLCRACEGAFPTLVVELARPMIRARDIDRWPHRQWPEDALGTEDAAVPSMPEPHPIDYEWRYTARTADDLASSLAQGGGRIGCFGAPSVFARLMHRGADVILVDRNPGLPKHFESAWHSRMWPADLSQHLDRPKDESLFDVVLLDPPWYANHTAAWVNRALDWLRPGGRIALTMFPHLVRPTAWNERATLFESLSTIGSVRPMPYRASYTTPFFENETLSAFGLGDLEQWRMGDLIEIVVAKQERRLQSSPTDELSWDRVQLGRQVVAVRHTEDHNEPVRVEPPNEDGSFLLRSGKRSRSSSPSCVAVSPTKSNWPTANAEDEVCPFVFNRQKITHVGRRCTRDRMLAVVERP